MTEMYTSLEKWIYFVLCNLVIKNKLSALTLALKECRVSHDSFSSGKSVRKQALISHSPSYLAACLSAFLSHPLPGCPRVWMLSHASVQTIFLLMPTCLTH